MNLRWTPNRWSSPRKWASTAVYTYWRGCCEVCCCAQQLEYGKTDVEDYDGSDGLLLVGVAVAEVDPSQRRCLIVLLVETESPEVLVTVDSGTSSQVSKVAVG